LGKHLVIRPFGASEAVAVSAWAYEAPYNIYNGDPKHADDYLNVDADGYDRPRAT